MSTIEGTAYEQIYDQIISCSAYCFTESIRVILLWIYYTKRRPLFTPFDFRKMNMTNPFANSDAENKAGSNYSVGEENADKNETERILYAETAPFGYCPSCGHKLSANNIFCSHCGIKIPAYIHEMAADTAKQENAGE